MLSRPLASAYVGRCAASCLEEGSVGTVLLLCGVQRKLQPIGLIRSGSPEGLDE